MGCTILGKQPIYPQRHPAQHRNKAGIRITHRQPSCDALVALWDHEYGFVLYDFEPTTLFCRDKAVVVRDDFVSSRCAKPETLYLGEFHIADGVAELKFEDTAMPKSLLVELLCRTFGYRPLHPEAARVHDANPEVFMGNRSFGELQDLLVELRL